MEISYEDFLKRKIGYENVRDLIIFTGENGTTNSFICTGKGTVMEEVDEALQVAYENNAKAIMVMLPNRKANYCVWISKETFDDLGEKLKKKKDAVKAYEDRYLEGYNKIQEYIANRLLQQSIQ